MRMVKTKQNLQNLEDMMKKFLLVKEAQHTGEEAMRDYHSCLTRFISSSHNSLDYSILENDVLSFFSAIPDTSPARYNKPFQNINAFLNWLVEQDCIPKNPIKAHHLKKRRDEGNIKPVSIEDLKIFLSSLDKKSYTGLRDYTIIMVMLDTGIRTKEILNLRANNYSSDAHSLTITKTIAKTRQQRIVYLSNTTVNILEDFLGKKPLEWADWLFPNYEGRQLKVDHLDKSFAKHSLECGVKITPYQLRHSFATLFLKGGGDLFSLQHLMGHSDLRMTKRYTELDEDYIEQQHKSFSPVLLLDKKSSNRVRRL